MTMRRSFQARWQKMRRLMIPPFPRVGPRDRVRGRHTEVGLTRAVAAHLGDEELFLPIGRYRGEFLYRRLGPPTYRRLCRQGVIAGTGKTLA